MLSFKELSEKKKTPCKINPKLDDIKEKHGEKCPKCDGKGCKHCDGKGYHMSEAKKDDTYLEKDFKKRQANNEKARKDLMKGPQMKNPHFESKWYDPMEDPDFDHDEAERTRGQSGKPAKKKTKKTTKTEDVAYVSQEEVSEESNQSIAETETLLTFGQFCEGMTMKDFKANRRKLKRKEASADAKKRGHVGKEWYNSGRTYSPDEAKAGRANMQDHERSTRHRSAMDPEGDDSNYSADKTKNPKKLRKQKAMGEETELDEATRAAKEGKKDEHRVGVEIRAKQSAATLAAKRARQKVLDAHEKKTGKKLDISKTPEGKKHDQHFGGSRQTKKVKGAKETPLETHNRRVGRDTLRKLKHGKTSKEKKYDAAMAKHTSRYD